MESSLMCVVTVSDQSRVTLEPKRFASKKVLIVKVPAVAEEKGVQVVIVTLGKDGQTLKNLADFQVPGRAIYKFIAKRQPLEASNRRDPSKRPSRSPDQAPPKP